MYEDMVIDQKGLTLPHPRMHKRAFVLGPLAEIAGQIVHPVCKETITTLLEKVLSHARVE